MRDRLWVFVLLVIVQDYRMQMRFLRSNPGGLLEASIEIARQWINTGIIVSTKTKDGITDIRKAKSRALTNRPVVVLIDDDIFE